MNYPASHIVIYDGDCELCSRSTRFIFRHDRKHRFKFSPIKSAFGRSVYEALALNPEDPESFVAVVGGKAYIKSDAVIEVAITFGGVWKAVSLLKIAPRKIRDYIYGLVARRRKRILGGAGGCLTDPSFKSRSIE